MDFDLTEEQRLLKESVDRVVDDAYGDFEKRKEHQRGPRGFSDGLWSTYAELGLLGLPFEERHGVHIVQAWGMTETSPLAAVAQPPAGAEGEQHWQYRSKSGSSISRPSGGSTAVSGV